MWSDNESDVDLLRFRYLADTVTKVITIPSILPTTIGVYGDWGSGKSTLLRMVRAELEARPEFLCLSFNGWLFENYEDAKTALMGTILDAIGDRAKQNETTWEKAGPLLDTLRKRVNWLQLLTLSGRYALPAVLGQPHLTLLSAGQDIAKNLYAAVKGGGEQKELTVEEIEKVLRSAPDGQENARRSIREFQKDFAELVAATDVQAVVVFIDDLDRCLPDTIIGTLEAIKLFLFVPGTAFVLGADERLVEYAVRQRFPELPGTAVEVGRDYLEKLVQIPIRIPPLSGTELHSYLNLLFAQLRLPDKEYQATCAHVAACDAAFGALSFDVEAARQVSSPGDALTQLEADLDFVAQIAPVVAPVLGGSPRRAKRFLNMLVLRLTLGDARGLDLRRQVLAKLMLLEYLKPEFFKQLAGLQAAQDGRPEELAALEGFVRYRAEEPRQATKESRRAAPSEDGAAKPAERPAPRPAVPDAAQPWVADEWTAAWLALDPRLADVDLRPYFYIAHDRLGSLSGTALRLSPAASQALESLFSEKPVSFRRGLEKTAELSPPDLAAVFEALALKVRQAEDLGGNLSPQAAMLGIAERRPEITPQLVTLYASLPEAKVTLALPTQLMAVTKGATGAEAARTLVERWAKSPLKPLANAAAAALDRQTEGGRISPTRN